MSELTTITRVAANYPNAVLIRSNHTTVCAVYYNVVFIRPSRFLYRSSSHHMPVTDGPSVTWYTCLFTFARPNINRHVYAPIVHKDIY